MKTEHKYRSLIRVTKKFIAWLRTFILRLALVDVGGGRWWWLVLGSNCHIVLTIPHTDELHWKACVVFVNFNFYRFIRVTPLLIKPCNQCYQTGSKMILQRHRTMGLQQLQRCLNVNFDKHFESRYAWHIWGIPVTQYNSWRQIIHREPPTPSQFLNLSPPSKLTVKSNLLNGAYTHYCLESLKGSEVNWLLVWKPVLKIPSSKHTMYKLHFGTIAKLRSTNCNLHSSHNELKLK